MKKSIFIIGLILCLVLSMASCVRVEDSEKDKETNDRTQTSSSDFYKTDEDTLKITTPYGDVKYPKTWKDRVKTESGQNGDSFEVSFTAVLGNKNIPLYSFVFGETSEGYKLGTLKTNKETVDVYIIDAYYDAAAELDEEQLNLYYEMCEDVNVIISKLVYDNGMVLAD